MRAAPGAPPLLGGYALLEEIGRGGFAPVYRARHQDLGREVALKLLPPDRYGASGDAEERRQRFLREARLLARLEHPNVLAVLAFGEESDDAGGRWCWFAMPRMRDSLAERPPAIEGGRAAVQRAMQWILDAAKGLQACHMAGVLHRDVKPANLLLGADGRVRIGDFGLALDTDATRLTRAGAAVGTLRFAAPEQLRGEPVDHRGDVYGLGATLCHLLVGEVPLNLGAQRDALPRRAAQLPRRVRQILQRATAQDPRQRYSSVAEMARALERALDPRRRPRQRAMIAGLLGMMLGAGLAWVAQPDPSSEVAAYKPPPPLFDLHWPPSASTIFGPWHFDDPAAGLPPNLVHRAPEIAGKLPGEPAGLSLDFEARGRRYRAKLIPDDAIMRVELHVLDPSTPARRPAFDYVAVHNAFTRDFSWELMNAKLDWEGDGLPELILRGSDGESERAAIMHFGHAAWDIPQLGWLHRSPHRFFGATPVLVDWDGDGTQEVLFGDTGRQRISGKFSGEALLYCFNAQDGELENYWRLPGELLATPVLREEGGAPVLYFSLDIHEAGPRIGALYRLRPGGVPQRLPFDSQVRGRLGPPLVLEGAPGPTALLVAESRGLVRSVDLEDSRRTLWTHQLSGSRPSPGRLVDLDGDGAPELCLSTAGSLQCLSTAPEARERVVMSVRLEVGESDERPPSVLPDLTGDGRPELALASNRGVIRVISSEGRGRLLRTLEAPEPTWRMPDDGGPGDISAELVVLDDPPRLIAITRSGWLLGYRLDVEAPEDALWFTALTAYGVLADAVMLDSPSGEQLLMTASLEGYLTLWRLGEGAPQVVAVRKARHSIVARPATQWARCPGEPCFDAWFADAYGFMFRIRAFLKP